MGLQKGCPCCKVHQNEKEFIKVMDFSSGLVVYRVKTSMTSVQQLEKNINANDMFIIHNTTNRHVSTTKCISELEETIYCPRCRYIMKHAKDLLLNLSHIKERDVIGICDHCRLREQSYKPCYTCQKVVKEFIKDKHISNIQVRKNNLAKVKELTSRMKDFLMDSTKVDQIGPSQAKRKTRSETSLNKLDLTYKKQTKYNYDIVDSDEILGKIGTSIKREFVREVETTQLYKNKSESELTAINAARIQKNIERKKNIQFKSTDDNSGVVSLTGSSGYISFENKYYTSSQGAKNISKKGMVLPSRRPLSSELRLFSEASLIKEKTTVDKSKFIKKGRNEHDATEKIPVEQQALHEENYIKRKKIHHYSYNDIPDLHEASDIWQTQENGSIEDIRKLTASDTNIPRFTSEESFRSFSAAARDISRPDFSYFFIKKSDVIKNQRKLAVISSSELVKNTQDMYRAREEEARIKKEQELNRKFEEEEKKRIAKEEKKRLETEKLRKRQDEEENLRKQQKDEEKLRKRQEEEEEKLRKKQEEEDLRKKQEEEKLRKRDEEKLKKSGKKVIDEAESSKETSKTDKESKKVKQSEKSDKESVKSKDKEKRNIISEEEKQRKKEEKEREQAEKQEKMRRAQEVKQRQKEQRDKEKALKEEQMRLAKEEKQKLKEENEKALKEKMRLAKEEKQKSKEDKEKEKPKIEEKTSQKDESDKKKEDRKDEVNRNEPVAELKSKKDNETKLQRKLEAEKNKKEAQLKLRLLKETKVEDKSEKPQTKKVIEETQKKELNINEVKIRRPSPDDLILELVRLKQAQGGPRERPTRMSQIKIPGKVIIAHKQHKNIKTKDCVICMDSDLELDIENIILNEGKTEESNDIIIGQKIFKYKPTLVTKPEEIQISPLFFTAKHSEDGKILKTEVLENTLEEKEQIKPSILAGKYVEQEIPKGITRYALSDRTFIEKGWTMLPTEKVVRKMNVYRMRPSHPEFDWFEHNKSKKLICYDTGEKLAEFNDNGKGRWFYRSGRVALDYYDAEEVNAQQRIVIFSSGELDERGRSRPLTILATFDYLGNGIVFDHSGKIRLKYNQTEGVVLDRSIGPVSHWKWHTLNDPPVLQQVMIDTQMAHKDPAILKLGGPNENKPRPDNEEMLAIEFDNFIKEKSKKLTQQFKPFQIKMKALKINEHFSLKVLDQATVYLIFRDGSTNLKLNIGMILDHQEIVDTDTAEVGEVSNNLERFPARTDSLAGLQRSVAHAQRVEHSRVERERRLRPAQPTASVDRLTLGLSRPLRTQLHTVASTSDNRFCKCRKPSTTNLYYDSRLN